MKKVILLALFSLVLGCGTENMSQLQDIYTNDRETRRDPTLEELLWTVSLRGCTGSMLTGSLLLTANHCSPSVGSKYTSGASLVNGGAADLTVRRIVERSSSFDYAIVEVSWNAGMPSTVQKYTPFIMTQADQLTLGGDDVATKLFTVGFPVDKGQRATYAEGYAKAFRTSSLMYNVGSINGNSGGAVWRSDNFMLVSQTNFGPHNYGQPGWRDNNPENTNAWNGGGRMDRIYAQSQVLKQIFPEGDNVYVDEVGNLLVEQDGLDNIQGHDDFSANLKDDMRAHEDYLLYQ